MEFILIFLSFTVVSYLFARTINWVIPDERFYFNPYFKGAALWVVVVSLLILFRFQLEPLVGEPPPVITIIGLTAAVLLPFFVFEFLTQSQKPVSTKFKIIWLALLFFGAWTVRFTCDPSDNECVGLSLYFGLVSIVFYNCAVILWFWFRRTIQKFENWFKSSR